MIRGQEPWPSSGDDRRTTGYAGNAEHCVGLITGTRSRHAQGNVGIASYGWCSGDVSGEGGKCGSGRQAAGGPASRRRRRRERRSERAADRTTELKRIGGQRCASCSSTDSHQERTHDAVRSRASGNAHCNRTRDSWCSADDACTGNGEHTTRIIERVRGRHRTAGRHDKRARSTDGQ